MGSAALAATEPCPGKAMDPNFPARDSEVKEQTNKNADDGDDDVAGRPGSIPAVADEDRLPVRQSERRCSCPTKNHNPAGRAACDRPYRLLQQAGDSITALTPRLSHRSTRCLIAGIFWHIYDWHCGAGTSNEALKWSAPTPPPPPPPHLSL